MSNLSDHICEKHYFWRILHVYLCIDEQICPCLILCKHRQLETVTRRRSSPYQKKSPHQKKGGLGVMGLGRVWVLRIVRAVEYICSAAPKSPGGRLMFDFSHGHLLQIRHVIVSSDMPSFCHNMRCGCR